MSDTQQPSNDFLPALKVVAEYLRGMQEELLMIERDAAMLSTRVRHALIKLDCCREAMLRHLTPAVDELAEDISRFEFFDKRKQGKVDD